MALCEVELTSAIMGDRYNIFSQMEHLQSKYVGTGHSDTTKWEWMTNQHRDTLSSYIGNTLFVAYLKVRYLSNRNCRW